MPGSELSPDNKYTPAQIFLRGFVYLAIAIATELLSILSSGAMDPRIAAVKLMITGLLTFRAYMDKTPSHGSDNYDDRSSETSQQQVQAE